MTYEDIKKVNETIKTTDIKGKEYAEVNQRIKAFRMLYPQGYICSRILNIQDGVIVIQAECGYYGDDGKAVELATGIAYEKENSSFINKTSYIENCETSAVGRALGMAGFGIDTSVASYEEVANAVKNQEKPAFNESHVTDTRTAELIDLCHKKGVKVSQLLKRYKVTGLPELSDEQYKEAKGGLSGMSDVNMDEVPSFEVV